MKRIVALLITGVVSHIVAVAQPVTNAPGIAGLATSRATVNFEQLAAQGPLEPATAPQIHPRMLRPNAARTAALTEVGSDFTELTGFGLPSPAPGANFQGLADNGFSIPPDTMGAVGPNHLMVAANTQVRIQNKSGGVLSTVSLNNFWAPVGGAPDAFDPKLSYDPTANRWIFSAGANGFMPNSAILLGVSASSDPLGQWYLYSIDVDSTDTSWADYPSLGFNKDWIVVSVNMFGNNTPTYDGAAVFVFNKTNLYANGLGQFTRFTVSSGFTMQPAVTYDDGLAAEYLLESYQSYAGQLRISRVVGLPNAPVLQIGYANAIGTPWDFGNWGNFLPQLGTVAKADGGDDRILNCVYRNGSLWAAHTAFLPLYFSTRAAAQWWQLSTNGVVQQFGRVDDPANVNSYAYPTIAVNKNNDVLLGYTRASSVQYFSANYSFRFGTEAAGSMHDDTVFKAGEGCYVKTFGSGENRWGDYSSTVVDPVNDVTMWTIQEYAGPSSGGCFDGSGNWGLWWARVDAAQAGGVTANAAITAEGYSPTNGFVDPGETITLRLTLRNSSQLALTNVTATLVATNGVFSPSPLQSYGVLAVNGASVNKNFSFVAGGVCGGYITNTFAIQAFGSNLARVSFAYPLGGQVTRLSQNFDFVKPPALPTNWVVSNNGPSAWVTTSNIFATASNSIFAADAEGASDVSLTSPAFSITATNAQLTFAQRYNTEYGFDGGVLEICINNGPYVDFVAAGGLFLANGYNFNIDNSFGNPLAGREAWTGDSGTNFVTTVAILPASAANRTVRLRWRMATDPSVSMDGWYIDSVVVTDRTCGRPIAPVILLTRRDNDKVLFSYNSKLGIRYLIESQDVIGGPWRPMGTDDGDGTMRSLTNSIGTTQRFYRLHEL